MLKINFYFVFVMQCYCSTCVYMYMYMYVCILLHVSALFDLFTPDSTYMLYICIMEGTVVCKGGNIAQNLGRQSTWYHHEQYMMYTRAVCNIDKIFTSV